ncbi:MAG: hypothetical protein IIA61_06665 [Candidatus Marinimicrobia bacterium]|nr:hypothetical protein [Candidatus Neomarinimicrobiota bacterium]
MLIYNKTTNLITVLIIISNITFAQNPRGFYWELGGKVYMSPEEIPVDALVQLVAVSDHYDKTGKVLKYIGEIVGSVLTEDIYCGDANYAFNAEYTTPDESVCTDIMSESRIYYGILRVRVYWNGQYYDTSVDFDYSPGGDNNNPIYKYASPDCYIDFDVETLNFTEELQAGYPSISNNFVFTAPDDYDFQNYDYHWFGTINVVSDVVIPTGRKLTIEPGTLVKFNNGKKPRIYGTLIAKGTDGNRITFTRAGESGNWYGIRFEDSSVDANCIIKCANIEYATYGIYSYKAEPEAMNNTISNCYYGIYYSSARFFNCVV